MTAAGLDTGHISNNLTRKRTDNTGIQELRNNLCHYSSPYCLVSISKREPLASFYWESHSACHRQRCIFTRHHHFVATKKLTGDCYIASSSKHDRCVVINKRGVTSSLFLLQNVNLVYTDIQDILNNSADRKQSTWASKMV